MNLTRTRYVLAISLLAALCGLHNVARGADGPTTVISDVTMISPERPAPLEAGAAPRVVVIDEDDADYVRPGEPVGSRSTPEPPPSASHRYGEMCGMLVWSVLLSALFASAWTLFVRHANWAALADTFFLTTAASWAVIVPSRLWTGVKTLEDSWSRRLVLMCCGFGVGQ